eukprot:8555895-Alexandrium_andersonii.AAC.1
MCIRDRGGTTSAQQRETTAESCWTLFPASFCRFLQFPTLSRAASQRGAAAPPRHPQKAPRDALFVANTLSLIHI